MKTLSAAPLAGKMNRLHPESAAAMTEHRREAVRMAKTQDADVLEKCKRTGVTPPGYMFDELIGKGSFGRVYKGHQTKDNRIVAIKVIDVDDADFRAIGDQKDDQIGDFNKEIRTLRRAQESGAPNLNQMIEALSVHSQLWLICEYCPGGSVKTLMRATEGRLQERYILVTARELSKALKGLHDAGIMHRDIKAANVLIHEEGKLQLCDFGVATVLDKKTDKRRTFIGTLHWMPPELWDRDPEYSDEVDVWAFGCTLYECATGTPPNADLREPHQLGSRMRRMNQSIELPDNGDYSAGLQSLVSFALTPDAATRPSFGDVLKHEYLADTEKSHPTAILSELVKTYYGWLYGGGHRASLFMAGGAPAAGANGEAAGAWTTADDEWNFSASDTFEHRMSTVLNIPNISDLAEPRWSETGDLTPRPNPVLDGGQLTAEAQANFEERVRRGADLSNIFDQNKPKYEYVTKQDFVPVELRRVSDLPLRAMSEERPYSIANQVIDLGDFDSSNYYPANNTKEEKIKLVDAAIIKANRGNSKLYSDGGLSGALTARPSTAPRPPTGEFVFPPTEWTNTYKASDHQDESATAPKLRDPTKHKTMEWSFATAISEAQLGDVGKPAPISKEEPEITTTAIAESSNVTSRLKKHDTMQWSFESAMTEAAASSVFTSEEDVQRTSRRITPPSFQSISTEPESFTSEMSASSSSRPPSDSSNGSKTYSDVIDPFAPSSAELDPSAQQFPTLASHVGTLQKEQMDGASPRAPGWPPHHAGLVIADQVNHDYTALQADSSQEAVVTTDGAEVTMPSIHAVDPRALDDAAFPSVLESELERLLSEMQGVLSGARAAIGMISAPADGNDAGKGNGPEDSAAASMSKERGRPRLRKKRTPGATGVAHPSVSSEGEGAMQMNGLVPEAGSVVSKRKKHEPWQAQAYDNPESSSGYSNGDGGNSTNPNDSFSSQNSDLPTLGPRASRQGRSRRRGDTDQPDTDANERGFDERTTAEREEIGPESDDEHADDLQKDIRQAGKRMDKGHAHHDQGGRKNGPDRYSHGDDDNDEEDDHGDDRRHVQSEPHDEKHHDSEGGQGDSYSGTGMPKMRAQPEASVRPGTRVGRAKLRPKPPPPKRSELSNKPKSMPRSRSRPTAVDSNSSTPTTATKTETVRKRSKPRAQATAPTSAAAAAAAAAAPPPPPHMSASTKAGTYFDRAINIESIPAPDIPTSVAMEHETTATPEDGLAAAAAAASSSEFDLEPTESGEPGEPGPHGFRPSFESDRSVRSVRSTRSGRSGKSGRSGMSLEMATGAAGGGGVKT